MADEQSKMMGKFRANSDSQSTNGVSKSNKRNRQPLSCQPCRQRKLKCDRAHPCETCVKRNEAAGCNYSKVPATSKVDSAGRVKAQDRLRQLENLVMQMVDSDGTTPSTGTSTSSGAPATTVSSFEADKLKDGKLEQSGLTSKYVGSTHWSAILENIQELKAAMEGEGSTPEGAEEPDEVDTPDQEILFGSKQSISLQQILTQFMPPRMQVDRLLSAYFNAKYAVIPYIHTQQFQRQYEQFWRDPLGTDPLWLAVLFPICCMGSQLTAAYASPPAVAEQIKAQSALLLTASAHCLVLGGYTKPKKWVVEALALYSQCKYASSADPSREVGIIWAILIRLAYRMGYHRDPDHFPQFLVFEGEMRRRVWTMCRQFDLMVSFQLGLPNSIPLDSWDTKMPRNLIDADFDEDTKVLPVSRPETEPTQILYFICKSRLMTNFGRICQHALSFKNSSQADVMALDAEVRQTFSTVPDILRIRSMSQSFAEPSYLLMVRLNCKFLYEKSLLVLHRKYMTQGYAVSTKACINSAVEICTCLLDMHKEFQPGGQLYQDRWMLTSFTMNDFLLASMILCLAISQWRKRNPGADITKDPEALQQLSMLRASYQVCQERSEMSLEARKVASGLKAMLTRFPQHDIPDVIPSRDSSRECQTGFTRQPDVMNLMPLSLSEPPTQQEMAVPMFGEDTAPFENFFTGSDNIDWQSLDRYLNNSETFDPNATPGDFPDPQNDWESEPLKFFGADDNIAWQSSNEPPSGFAFLATGGGIRPLNGSMVNGGPENGFMPRY